MALANFSRLIIADFTKVRSLPQEIGAIAPYLRSVPVQPIIHVSDAPWAMAVDFADLPQILSPHVYVSLSSLEKQLDEHVIRPAERRVVQLRRRRAELERRFLRPFETA